VLSSPAHAQEPRYPTLFSAAAAQQPAVRNALAWLEQNFPKQVEEWIRITEMLRDRRAHPLIQTAVDVHEFFGIRSRAVATGSTDANAGVVRGIPSISMGRSTGGDQHTLSEWAGEKDALPASKIAPLISVLMAGLSTTTS
jgi:hypothetical protein